MAVDPDSVVVMPTPMPWNPHPVNAADVIARPIDVIRPVTNFDVHNDRIYHGCHCRKYCQKYPNFPFHIGNIISDYDERRTPFIRHSRLDRFAINLEHNSSRKHEKVNFSASRAGTVDGSAVDVVR